MCIVIIFIRTLSAGCTVCTAVDVCVCVSAVQIAVYRLYNCGLQALLLVQSHEITCSLPALYRDGTVKGCCCLLAFELYCKMANVDREIVACSTISNFSVV